jgi:hypothetical protein
MLVGVTNAQGNCYDWPNSTHIIVVLLLDLMLLQQHFFFVMGIAQTSKLFPNSKVSVQGEYI